jgi:hypothetical protein
MKIKNLTLIIIFLFIFAIITNTASAAWSNTSFFYKAPININNTGNASILKNFQVNLNVSWNSNMNANFSDIRIYNDTSGLLVPYWNESVVNSSYANIWFNASSIPASIWTNTTYYLYYNNSSAKTLSNGNATFIQWHGADSNEFIEPVQSKITNIVYEAIGRQNNINSNVWWGMATSMTDSPVDGQYVKQYSTTYYTFTFNNSVGTNVNTGGIITAGTYYRMKFTRTTTQLQGYLNDVLFMTPITTNLPDAPMGIGMNFADANTGDQLWSFLREFAPIQPTSNTGIETILYSNNYTNDGTLNFSVFKGTTVKFLYTDNVTNWYVNGVSQGLTTNYFNYTFMGLNTTSNISVTSATAINTWNVKSLVYSLELISPTNGSTILSPVTLVWREWPLNTSYTYQISTDNQFINIVSSGSGTTNGTESITSTQSLTPGIYYWHAKNSTSTYTNWFNFTITSAPTTPGRLNITAFDEQNQTLRIYTFNVTIYGLDGTILTKNSGGTGWVNFSSSEIISQQYLVNIPILPTYYASRSILADSPGNATLYLPNYNNNNTIDNVVFSLKDYTGFFPWTTSKFYLKINNTVMHSSFFGADDTISTFLIRGYKYSIIIENGNSVNIWDSFSSVQSALATLTISDYGFNSSLNSPWNFSIISGSIDFKWNFTLVPTFSSLTYKIFKNGTQDYILVTSVKSGQNIYISNNNSIYITQLSILKIDGTYVNYTQVFDKNAVPSQYGNAFQNIGYGTFTISDWMKYLIGIGIVIIICSLFTILNAPEGGLIVSIISLVLYVFRFLPQTVGGLNFYIIIVILSILSLMVNREKS